MRFIEHGRQRKDERSKRYSSRLHDRVFMRKLRKEIGRSWAHPIDRFQPPANAKGTRAIVEEM